VGALFVVPDERNTTVIKPHWYLLTELGHPRRLDQPGLAGRLDELFGDHTVIDPARTGAAIEVAVQMAEYLTAAVPHGASAVSSREDLTRFLHAMNLLLSGFAQVGGRLALHVRTSGDTALTGIGDRDRAAASDAMATATARLIEAAGLVKEACLHTATKEN
jgi:hypothetical protein